MGTGPVFQPHSLLKEVGERAFGYGSLPGVECRFYAQLWKALPCGTADLDRVRRVGSQRDCRQTNGEEATDEMEPAHCPELPRCSHSRAEWHLGKRISTLAPGFPANRGTAPGRGRSMITPQLCMLSYSTCQKSRCSLPFPLPWSGSGVGAGVGEGVGAGVGLGV